MSLDNFTLHNFHYLLFDQMHGAADAILNTFRVRHHHRLRSAIFLAFAIAYIASAAGCVPFRTCSPFLMHGALRRCPASCWRSASMPPTPPPPFALYGTGALLVVIASPRAFSRSPSPSNAAAMQQPPSGNGGSGARFSAATRPARYPLGGCCRCSRNRCPAAWILVFIPATRELSIGDLPRRARNTRVISVMTVRPLASRANFEVLSALGIILLIVTAVIAAVRLSSCIGRDFMLRRQLMDKLAAQRL